MISGNANGIEDTGGGDDLIAGNIVGVNAAGTSAVGNTSERVYVDTAGDTIGGTTSAARNVVSGNVSGGIVDLAGSDNLVQGDYVGVGVDGITPIGNGGVGVDVNTGNNLIGGPTATPGAAPGNVISGNTDGVVFYNDGSVGNAAEGNLIGLGADGSTAVGNSTYGIYVVLDSQNVTIGGPMASDRNVISASGYFGIMRDAETSGLVIQGNDIGTDITGSLARPNEYGVQISSSGALIGGLTSTPVQSPGNVISGNGTVEGAYGIVLAGGDAAFEGNLIGTNAAGSAALGNLDVGLWLNSTGNTVGGTATGAGNVVSGNGGDGILIQFPDNLVAGNLVGTDLTGHAAVPNRSNGISMIGSATGNTIGGTTPGAGNAIRETPDTPWPSSLRERGRGQLYRRRLQRRGRSGQHVWCADRERRGRQHHRRHGCRRGQRHLGQPRRRRRDHRRGDERQPGGGQSCRHQRCRHRGHSQRVMGHSDRHPALRATRLAA